MLNLQLCKGNTNKTKLLTIIHDLNTSSESTIERDVYQPEGGKCLEMYNLLLSTLSAPALQEFPFLRHMFWKFSTICSMTDTILKLFTFIALNNIVYFQVKRVPIKLCDKKSTTMEFRWWSCMNIWILYNKKLLGCRVLEPLWLAVPHLKSMP